jgi:hypothetical protein
MVPDQWLCRIPAPVISGFERHYAGVFETWIARGCHCRWRVHARMRAINRSIAEHAARLVSTGCTALSPMMGMVILARELTLNEAYRSTRGCVSGPVRWLLADALVPPTMAQTFRGG